MRGWVEAGEEGWDRLGSKSSRPRTALMDGRWCTHTGSVMAVTEVGMIVRTRVLYGDTSNSSNVISSMIHLGEYLQLMRY